MNRSSRYRAARVLVAFGLGAGMLQIAYAQAPVAAAPTYADLADLADLADSAGLVAHVSVRSLARVKDERAPGLRPGEGRFYVRAKTRALLFGAEGVGDALGYLVDLPLDARGKPPSMKKQDMLVFARTIAGRPGELQLVGRQAQVPYRDTTLATLRPILTELARPDAPPPISGVREIIHVPGDLAGSGETQIFLASADNSAASITVRRQPGRAAEWGVSFSELVAETGTRPAAQTLTWYRLACFLPNTLPARLNLSESAVARQQALADYRLVLGDLGPCPRTLKP
jgi:hypothetical protein